MEGRERGLTCFTVCLFIFNLSYRILSSFSCLAQFSRCQKSPERKMPRRSTESTDNFSVQRQILELKGQLSEKESELLRLECGLLPSSSGPESTSSNSSAVSDHEELQAKYDRLVDAHKKLQRTNMCLEEKLLKIVDKFEGEKNIINRDLSTQTQKVVEAKLTIQQLHKQNTELKSDLHVALNILQMKPSSFVSQRVDSLPEDLQVRVKQQGGERQEDRRGPRTGGGQKITVAVPNGALAANNEEAVSAAILARVLEERENERKKEEKFCIDIGTQTHRWQFPDTLQLLKHSSRARNLLAIREEYSLLEELSLISAAEKSRLFGTKDYLDDSDCISEEEENELESLLSKDLRFPRTHVSNILLASLLQPEGEDSPWTKSKYSDNDVNRKKEEEKSSLIQPLKETMFGVGERKTRNIETLSETASDSVHSFDLLGSSNIVSNEGRPVEPEPHYESLKEVHNSEYFQRQNLYSSQPSSVSSLFSLTQRASNSGTKDRYDLLQRSFSTSSYSATQTEL